MKHPVIQVTKAVMLACRMGWGPGMFFLIFGTFVTFYCARKLAEVSEYKGYRFTTYRHISTAILGASCISFFVINGCRAPACSG